LLSNQYLLTKPPLLLSLVLCFPLMLPAQRSLQYTLLTAEDGLSNNSVQCIIQDRSGIMWIGTNGGLNRYDGSSFIQYSILSQPSLSNNVVTSLRQGEDGNIWIGTENGLNILDPLSNTIRQFVHQDLASTSIPQGAIRAIQKTKSGHTWVMSDYWLLEFETNDSFFRVSIDPSFIKENMVLVGLTESGNNEVWLSYLDRATMMAKRTNSGSRLERIDQPQLYTADTAKIFTDSSDITWSISAYGMNRFNKSSGNFHAWIRNPYNNAPNLHLHSCHSQDADGNVWQGNERGSLVKYNLQQQKVADYSWLVATINATLVYCIYRDNNNNIWVGTDNGIIKISNRSAVFNNIPFVVAGKELKNIRCRRIMTDRNNTWYAATENYGLLKRMRGKNGMDTTIALSTFGATPVSNLPFHNNSLRIKLNGRYDIGYIYDMWYDDKDIIWLAGYGISCYNIRNDSLEIFLAGNDDISRAESVNQFSICFDGHLFWTAGQNNVFTFDPATRKMQPFKDNKGNMPFAQLPCWSLTLKGDWIWAGSAKGLYKINIHTKEVVKLSIHPVLEYGINDIAMDGDSSCWISTAGGGVIYYNEYSGKIKQYTNRDGLSNNTVCGLLRDNKNDLWISTYAGLSYFNRQTNQFTNFYTKDGLNIDEFNRKAFYKLHDGRMVFGGLNGYTVFDPAEAFKRDRPVAILLTRFTRINKGGETEETVFHINSLRKVVIYPGDRFFSFYFTLSDMYDPSGNRYYYQLEGVDKAWHSLGNQHFVSFNGLSPGTYTLKIKGSVGKGSASVNEISVDILVRQVFYKTAWFIILMSFAVAAIVYLIGRYRINQVKKIQYLRTRIASDLHDDVGSSLVRITVLADAIKREEVKETTSEQLGTIAGISRGAVSTMKDVIWSIDSRNDTMNGMIGYMQEHLYNMLTPANIDFELTHTGLTGNEKLRMNFRQNVYLTFKEAVNNIVKHSGASRVNVELKRENGYFVMRIMDNGKGINSTRNGSGQGLYNMKLRADRLKASLEISSVNGLTILMKVPV
jgi:ligand-binding sensor domain-containing protein/two-component sensor histidine kinase